MELYDDTVMQLTTSTIIDQTGKGYKNTPIESDIQTNVSIEKGQVESSKNSS